MKRSTGLVYSSDAGPGITRVRRGRGFAYRSPSGRLLRDPATLRRIARLAVPPAWTDVWISPNPRGHLQATGRDARRRSDRVDNVVRHCRIHFAGEFNETRGEIEFARFP